MLKVKYRPMVPNDSDMILATWIHSARNLNNNRWMTPETYKPNQKRIVERFIERSSIMVVVNADDEEQALAWSCFNVVGEFTILHYMFTKKPYRRLGLQREFVKHLGDSIVLTNISKTWADWRNKNGFIYDPYIIERLKL